MKSTITLALGAGLVLSVVSQAQQASPTQLEPSQAAIAACDELPAKPGSVNPAQNEAGRVGSRFFSKAIKTLAPSIARATHNDVQPSDLAQATAEAEAKKTREKQEHAKYCAALKEAAKRSTPLPPTTKVIEACPPSSTRATGTPYCLKSDNTLVDVLHITVPTNPTVSAPSSLTPAPPVSAAPTPAQH
jgi:hypothetical protein